MSDSSEPSFYMGAQNRGSTPGPYTCTALFLQQLINELKPYFLNKPMIFSYFLSLLWDVLLYMCCIYCLINKTVWGNGLAE